MKAERSNSSYGLGNTGAWESSPRGSDPKKLNPGTGEAMCAQTPSLEVMPPMGRNGKQKQRWLRSRRVRGLGTPRTVTGPQGTG